MDIATILGTSGAILSTISNIPQCYKVRNANTTNDIHSYSQSLYICCQQAYGQHMVFI